MLCDQQGYVFENLLTWVWVQNSLLPHRHILLAESCVGAGVVRADVADPVSRDQWDALITVPSEYNFLDITTDKWLQPMNNYTVELLHF